MRSQTGGPFWLAKMEENMPEAFRKLELRVLMRMTAASCSCKTPSLRGMDSGERLRRFRRFTAEAVKACSEAELPSFRENMYRRAFRTGRALSHLPGLKDRESRKRLIVLLYRNIGIEVKSEEEESGEAGLWRIRIPHCSFSPAYTPVMCHVMSGMDAGIICGILGGGRLEFDQRITEGCPHCSALYQKTREALYE